MLEDDISKVNTRKQMQIAISGIRQDISEYLTYNGYSEKMHDAISGIIDKHSKL
jgi:cytochrome b involved in lipid metabolism